MIVQSQCSLCRSMLHLQVCYRWSMAHAHIDRFQGSLPEGWANCLALSRQWRWWGVRGRKRSCCLLVPPELPPQKASGTRQSTASTDILPIGECSYVGCAWCMLVGNVWISQYKFASEGLPSEQSSDGQLPGSGFRWDRAHAGTSVAQSGRDTVQLSSNKVCVFCFLTVCHWLGQVLPVIGSILYENR